MTKTKVTEIRLSIFKSSKYLISHNHVSGEIKTTCKVTSCGLIYLFLR